MSVPELSMYYPLEDQMDKQQLAFYKTVEASLSKGEYIDVEGERGYVFTYLYKLLEKWNTDGYESLCDFLIYLSELYKHDNKLSDYCLLWAYDCLLGLKRYEEYIEKTEPLFPYGTLGHRSNLRLNIQRKISVDADPLDILLMVGGRRSKFITNNQALYRDKIREVFAGFAEENGDWFDTFDKWLSGKKSYPHILFNGSVSAYKPVLDFEIYSYYAAYDKLHIITDLSKVAENAARKEMGVPQIGEGWISETELFRKLESAFSMTTVIQHGQPKWLGRQHFDIWFPNWKIAVEYHGQQHFEPIEFFGGKEAFDKTVERDNRKAELSRKNGVQLFVVTSDYDLDRLINNILNIANGRKISAPDIL